MLPETFFVATGIVLGMLTFLCLYRAVIGPSAPDRVVAVNVIGTITLVILVLFAFIYGRTLYIDVAIVYAMINFLSTLTISRYLEKGRVTG
ncbi:MAG: cation:proton antiporter [Methanobacteriota archaeon]|nr:MAG: cation:proton antiporter [Euryarchaeota archaeon]